MTIQLDRAGHVAIIVTAREYQALAAATADYEVNHDPLDGATADEGRDLRALKGLLSKCQDAGIRTTRPEPA